MIFNVLCYGLNEKSIADQLFNNRINGLERFRQCDSKVVAIDLKSSGSLNAVDFNQRQQTIRLFAKHMSSELGLQFMQLHDTTRFVFRAQFQLLPSKFQTSASPCPTQSVLVRAESALMQVHTIPRLPCIPSDYACLS